jgi:hypothetical protein
LGLHKDFNFQNGNSFKNENVWPHSLKLSCILESLNVIPRLHSQPTPFHAFALVASLRLYGHDIAPFKAHFFEETSFPRGNVIVGRHFPKENIQDGKKHEQDKETTYGTLKTRGANQGFPKPSSLASTFFWLKFGP